MPTPEDGGRWGILGGTFDPVHRGHLTLASEIATKTRMAGTVLVPAFRHPFKAGECRASFDDRLAMLKLTVGESQEFFISDIERSHNLSGYTIDTVRTLKAAYPKAEFHFIIGADNASKLSSWHQPEEIASECQIVVGSRPPLSDVDTPPEFEGRIQVVATELVDLSSSEIRDCVQRGCDTNCLQESVGKPVAEYILKNKLYR